MIDDKLRIWNSPPTRQLAEVFASIDSLQEMQDFLRDIMTANEITEISSRLEAARMLTAGNKYTEIVAKTKLSSRTIARISDWLQNGCNGYQAALRTMNAHHGHI